MREIRDEELEKSETKHRKVEGKTEKAVLQKKKAGYFRQAENFSSHSFAPQTPHSLS